MKFLGKVIVLFFLVSMMNVVFADQQIVATGQASAPSQCGATSGSAAGATGVNTAASTGTPSQSNVGK